MCSQVRRRFCGVFTARSELCKVLFLALSLTFLYVYDISGELLNGFAQGRCVWSLARTSLNVKVKSQRVKVTMVKTQGFRQISLEYELICDIHTEDLFGSLLERV